MKSRLCFASRWLKLSERGRRFKPSGLVVVLVALCASVLVPVTAAAHDPVFVPRTETRQVEVYKMVPQPDEWGVVRTEDVFEDRQVQVGTEDVFEDRQVQVDTVDVFEDRKVKVGTQPVQVGTERVKVGTEPVYSFKNELVKVVTYEERLTPVYGYRSVQYPCPPPDRPCFRRERYVTGFEPRTVEVVSWEWQRVRVQTGTRDVFETRPVIEHHDVFVTRSVKVGTRPVFETRSVKVGTRPVFETRSVKVGTRDVEGWIPQPDKRVFSHFETRTVVDPNPDHGTYTHDPSEHTCPTGQHMRPFPKMWAIRGYNGEPTTYQLAEPSDHHAGSDIAVVAKWYASDLHTGCHIPNHVFAPKPAPGGAGLAGLLDDLKKTVTAVPNAIVKPPIVKITTELRSLSRDGYAAIHLGVCFVDNFATVLADMVAGGVLWKVLTKNFEDTANAILEFVKKHPKVASALASVVGLTHAAFCAYGVDPVGDLKTTDDSDTADTDDDETPTTTTTTTTTTTAAPDEEDESEHPGAWDPKTFELRRFPYTKKGSIPKACTQVLFSTRKGDWMAVCPK